MKKINGGLFIVFEGGEGTGKSTQSKILHNFLTKQGFETVLTREPGGTVGAEEIRDLLLFGEAERWDETTEALLYLAARANHWNRKISPLLNEGKIVISDRFHESSVVYQGFCRGVDIDFLNSIFQYITKNKMPDRIYLIMVEPKIGVARSLARDGNQETRFENMDIDFHKKVHEGFQKIYEKNKERFLYIDGSQTVQQISDIIIKDIVSQYPQLNS